MKTKSIAIGLLASIALTGLFLFTNNNIKAQGNPHQKQHDVVIISTSIREKLYRVEVYNASPGAPQMYDYWSANGRPLIPVAEALAALRDEGFRITHMSVNGNGYTLERP